VGNPLRISIEEHDADDEVAGGKQKASDQPVIACPQIHHADRCVVTQEYPTN